MSRIHPIWPSGVFVVAGFAFAATPASAHTIVGNRLFPATLTIDDPGVNDELAFPTFSQLTASNFDGSAGASSFTLGAEFQKTITADLSVSIGSEGVTFQRNPRATGFANIETGAKYAFYQDPDHEFIFAGAVNVEIGGTGSSASSALPSDPFTTVTPMLYVGKGFGDSTAEWLRPFAVTAQAGYSIPTQHTNSIDGSANPTIATYGFSLQYSLLYKNAFVSEVPKPFRNFIPAFEGIFSTPVANTGLSDPDDFSVHTTTGVVGPSLYYIGTKYEVGVMMQIPVNRASGHHPGVLAIVDFFLDDIAPDSIGKPLFGAPQARRSTY
jgi:hypothetical protein